MEVDVKVQAGARDGPRIQQPLKLRASFTNIATMRSSIVFGLTGELKPRYDIVPSATDAEDSGGDHGKESVAARQRVKRDSDGTYFMSPPVHGRVKAAQIPPELKRLRDLKDSPWKEPAMKVVQA
jgi:hypothetical protein